MFTFDLIAERRIQEAQRNGEFDDLPGAGAPLELGDDLLVPAEVRGVYRVLKNAGFLPPEVQARRAVSEARAALAAMDPASQEYLRALHKLQFLDMQLSEQRGSGLRVDAGYTARILRRLSGE